MPDRPAPEPVSAAGGVAQVERNLALIIAVFGAVYSLQNLDGLIAGWPSMRGPLGAVVVLLVAGSVLTGLVAVVRPALAPRLFAAAVVLFTAGVLVWPSALHGVLPGAPPPWLTSMWPVEAVFLCGAVRRIGVPLAATGAAAAVLSGMLLGPAAMDPTLVATAVLPMVAICAVLVLLIGALRHRIRHAERSRLASLAEYRRTQQDAAAEAERVRTDALVHDSVLTTLLSAAAAASAEDEQLAARMAANALRVLAHVNRLSAEGEALPFALLLQHARSTSPAAFEAFVVDALQAEEVALPTAAADALLAAMVEAMDNSVRHAGRADRSLTAVPLGPDGIRVVVADDGAGFDALQAIASRRGLHRAVVERMRAVDGRADVVSAPMEGTRVVISWGSVVVHSTRPLLEEGVTVP